MRIAVLVTVYNRAEITVRGLTQLAALAESLSDEFSFHVYLVDDGSTDGTSSRVRDIPLDISITKGSGNLYWNRGMALAYETSRSSSTAFDAYMLFNDDVVLDDNFQGFMREFRALKQRILVGAFRDPRTGEVTYSGFVRRSRLRPTSFSKPELTGSCIRVDTFNGNLVLIPADVFDELGGLDPHYTHAYGDVDLGLRATATGTSSFVYGTPIGTCERGPSLDQRIRSANLRERWNLLFGHPHGPASHFRYVRRHGIKILFPAYVLFEITRRVKKLSLPRMA